MRAKKKAISGRGGPKIANHGLATLKTKAYLAPPRGDGKRLPQGPTGRGIRRVLAIEGHTAKGCEARKLPSQQVARRLNTTASGAKAHIRPNDALELVRKASGEGAIVLR